MKKALIILIPMALVVLGCLLIPPSSFASDGDLFGITHTKTPIWPEGQKLMSEAGIKMARVHVNWSAIEPTKNQWNFSSLDEYLGPLFNAGIQAYFVLCVTPEWAEVSHPPYPGECNPYWDPNYAPKSEEWRHFLEKIVGRYGCGSGGSCQVSHWGIYFEMNGSCFFLGSDNQPSAEEYLRVLTIAHDEIKSIDPSAKIIFGRLLPIADDLHPFSFLEEVIDLGGNPFFDIVSFGGPYSVNLNTWQNMGYVFRKRIQDIKQVTSKEIWATEVLATSSYNFNGENEQCEPDPYGEQIQAQLLKLWYQIAKEEGVQRVFWFDFSDLIYWKKPQFRCIGLVRHDLTPKPAYYAYQEMAGMPISQTGTISGTIWVDANGNGWPAGEGLYTCSGTQTKPKVELYKMGDPYTPIKIVEPENGTFQFNDVVLGNYRVVIRTPICNGNQYETTLWRVRAAPSDNWLQEVSHYCSAKITCADENDTWPESRWYPLKVYQNETTQVHLGIKRSGFNLNEGWNQITWPDVSGKKAADIPSECPIAVAKERFWFTPYVKNFGGVNFNFESEKTYYLNCNQEVTWNL